MKALAAVLPASRQSFAAALLCLAGFVALLQVPDHPADNSHDFGSQAAIEYWVQARFALGTDVIQNVGPYGFATYPSIYTGILDARKLAINIALTVLFAGLLWDLARRQALDVQAGVLVFVAAFAHQDAFFYLLVWLIARRLLEGGGAVGRALLFAALALLALSKGTFFFLSAAAVAAFALGEAMQGRLRAAASWIGFYLLSFLALWIASGQSLGSLPGFVAALFSFTEGYNEAMPVYEIGATTFCGVALVLLAGAISLWRVFAGRVVHERLRSRIFFCALELLILFVVWKHGYVRADIHVLAFINYVLVVCLLSLWMLPGAPEPRATPPARTPDSRWRWRASLLVVAFAAGDFISLASLERFSLADHFTGTLDAFESTLSALGNPAAYRTRMRDLLEQSVHEMRQLSEPFRASVGEERVSYVGVQPGFLVYSGLRYEPTPSTISFAAWNAGALRRDAAYLADPATSPRFVILALPTIDNRFVPQDDSLAKLELLQRYTPLRVDDDNVLFESRAGTVPVRVVLQASKTARLAEWVEVPDSRGALWVSMRIPRTLAARAVALLYKPPETLIEYRTDDGVVHRERLVASIAPTGFLIEPLITTTAELMSAYPAAALPGFEPQRRRELRRVRELRLLCGAEGVLCADDYSIEFSRVENLHPGL